MRQAKNLTTGPIPAHLVRLALPILDTSFIQMLYNFTDMAWLGRLDSGAVAAVGAASVFTWLANSFSLINKVGSEVSVANAIGRGEEAEAGHISGHALALALLFGGALCLFFLLFAPDLLSFYRLAPAYHHQGAAYLRRVAIGLPFVFSASAYTGIYNASGHSKVPFFISAIGLALNMILDPIFIFVLGAGSNGAAWATVISQFTVFSIFVYQLHFKDHLFGRVTPFARLTAVIVRRILNVGFPVALLNALFAVVNMSLGRFASLAGGHIGVLTLTTGGQLEAISWNTAQGFSTALSSFVSQNFGARRRDRILSAFRFTFSLTLIIGVLTTLFFYFGGEKLFSLIVPEPAAYASGGNYLRISAFSQLFMMIEVTCQGFFYGVNRSIPPALISIGGNLLRIPLALIAMHFIPGLSVLWWIISATAMLKGCVALGCFFAFRSRMDKDL